MKGTWARDEGGHRHRWENLGPRCSAMDRTGLLHLTSPHMVTYDDVVDMKGSIGFKFCWNFEFLQSRHVVLKINALEV